MRQDPGQVRQEALVDGQEAFCFDGFDEAVEDAAVEIARLVVHARHDRVLQESTTSALYGLYYRHG